MTSKVILVGVGGATCSGKTTLAKHLKHILPNSVIVHQDDFAPPQELVPIHPIHNIQDWDAAPGAIDWPRMRKFLRDVKRDGAIPPDHYSHDHFNEQKDIPVENETYERWQKEFKDLISKAGNKEVVWGLIDGFLLYWDEEVVSNLDTRIFLRVSHDVLKQRRHERHGYHAAVQSDPEGTMWRDPPGYWEQIVWPAYEDAHRDMFEDGDLDKGRPTGKVKDLVLVENENMNMSEMVNVCCEVLQKTLEGSNI